MQLTPVWVAVNLLFPVVLPPVIMFLAGYFLSSTPTERKNARVVRTVQEGQLGWVAIAWSALAVYEAWDYLEGHPTGLHFVLGISLGEFCVVIGALFVSVGGAMTASEAEPAQKRYMVWSIIVMVISGVMFSLVHWKTT